MKTRNFPFLMAALGLGLLVTACADPEQDPTTRLDGGALDGAENLCTDPDGDEDKDGIPNATEGCLSGRDSDRDKIPDWQDYDSDDDGVYDKVEAGEKDDKGKCTSTGEAWPCDTDGDGVPDYLDVDSDGDGLLDDEEDLNGDGLLGCCMTECNKPADSQKERCILTTDGCGPGQSCESGTCTPAIHFECSNGETSPLAKDTFGDGILDKNRGTYICRDASEDNPAGRKPIQLRKSPLDKGDWHVALETTAKYLDLTITDPGPKEAAAVIDEDDPQAEVAGFVISRSTDKENIQDELTEIIQTISTTGPGGQGTVSQRASGTQVKSHDRYDSIQGTVLDIQLATGSNPSYVRNELVAALLGRGPAQLGNLPGPYGTAQSEYVLRFITLKRVEFKKDADGDLVNKDGDKIKDAGGYPVDSGDQSKWRLIIMGAVAARTAYHDPTRRTGFIVDDLSGGTALATSSDTVGDECDVATITQLPLADIIWVVDESGSMSDNRQDIVNNANNFFSRALSSGLDFRMCVTNVVQPDGSYSDAFGKCCSQASSDDYDMGGTDRFLLPTEQSVFSSCINNPPGYEGYAEHGLENAKEAVTKHLPRATGAADKIRKNAKLVIIVATDEVPESLSSVIGSSNWDTCTLDSATQGKVNQGVQPYLDLFSGITDPEGAAMFHVIGGVCSNSCNADVAHGYKELAQQLGGQTADVCQQDLGNTLQIIIDSIIGEASPVELEYVPIATSLAVALDGKTKQRSRSQGFDYRPARNTVVFVNETYQKGSQVVASYKRWERQTIPD